MIKCGKGGGPCAARSSPAPWRGDVLDALFCSGGYPHTKSGSEMLAAALVEPWA